MIGISKLYCGTVEPSDVLRYNRESGALPSHLQQFSADKKPVVVWNITRRCNLKCVHCYSNSRDVAYENELTTEEGKQLIDDLAEFGSPVLLFSGGEPLKRTDCIELVTYAVGRGIRAVLSTNGTLITDEIALALKQSGISYVGISIDGLKDVNDKFRQVPGAFDAAYEGIKSCKQAGLKVGLRFTITKQNMHEVPGIFDFVEQGRIPRICFYHLVYTGRGAKLVENDLSSEQARNIVDTIIDRTAVLHKRGIPTEVLTVDNHCDGPYLYLRMMREGSPRTQDVMELLTMNGGNNSGTGIGCISWNGEVHADQFWRHYSFGNVRDRPFSEIWTDLSNPLMEKLKEKKKHVTGRCARCRFLEVCGGNLRVRAEAVYGDIWAHDPACYLTDEEIKLEEDYELSNSKETPSSAN